MALIKKAGFQTDINGLRGVAVLLVVLYHFNIGMLKGGFIGVDIFFVISGYLMTKIVWSAVDRGQFSYIGFLYRRAIRIFPALFRRLLSAAAGGVPAAAAGLGQPGLAVDAGADF